MSFDSTIPNPGDPIDQSQPQLLANFGAMYSAMQVNHIAMNLQDAGRHNQLLLTTVGDPTTATDEIALYQKIGTSSVPQLFFRPASNATPIQLTYQTTIRHDAANGSSQNQSYMAGPYIMLFGTINKVTNGQMFTYSTYYPNITFSTPPQVFIMPAIPDFNPAKYFPSFFVYLSPNNITITDFQITKSLAISLDVMEMNMNFLIIGKP